MADTGSNRVVAPRGMIRSTDSDFMGGLVARPKNVRFATQDADEVIYVITRKDVITNLAWILEIALGAIAPIVVISALNTLNADFTALMPARVMLLVLIIFYASLITLAILNITRWYFNVFIITNKRIIYYQFQPLTRYKASEAELRNIQDVSQSVIGFLPSLFNYGDLLIQTAGQKSKFQINRVPRATWLRDVLVDLSRMARGEL